MVASAAAVMLLFSCFRDKLLLMVCCLLEEDFFRWFVVEEDEEEDEVVMVAIFELLLDVDNFDAPAWLSGAVRASSDGIRRSLLLSGEPLASTSSTISGSADWLLVGDLSLVAQPPPVRVVWVVVVVVITEGCLWFACRCC